MKKIRFQIIHISVESGEYNKKSTSQWQFYCQGVHRGLWCEMRSTITQGFGLPEISSDSGLTISSVKSPSEILPCIFHNISRDRIFKQSKLDILTDNWCAFNENCVLLFLFFVFEHWILRLAVYANKKLIKRIEFIVCITLGEHE